MSGVLCVCLLFFSISLSLSLSFSVSRYVLGTFDTVIESDKNTRARCASLNMLCIDVWYTNAPAASEAPDRRHLIQRVLFVR